MKLTLPQLKPQLAKSLGVVYLLSGDDPFLKQEALDLIRAAAKKSGCQERVRLTPDSQFDPNELYTLLFSNSLLAEKRLIELDCRNATPNKATGEILQQYADNPSSDNTLVIDLNKLEDKISKSAWFKAFEKIGVTVTIWPIPPEQLASWLTSRAKEAGLQLTADAAKLLADYVEGNLTAGAQAIEKISLLQLNKPIDAKIIQAVLTNESQFTVFDFMAALTSGSTQRAIHILDQLKAEGTEPTLILWGITRELRQLSDLANGMKQGQSLDSLFQQYRVFARRQASMRATLQRITVENIQDWLVKAAELDRIIKGAVSGNIWDNLTIFCLRLAS